MRQQTKRDPYKLVGGKLDRYDIHEFVGLGGMGAVYRAQHEITKAVVAIKLLRPDLSSSEQDGINIFFEEAAKTVTLNHPSIIKVTSADYTEDGSAFMVMEWLDGRTLESALKTEGLFSPARTLKILDQVCAAVSYAHGKNIIHRDLKPSNIMLVEEESGEGAVRVLDFGIAKVLSATTGTNTRVAGTPNYISPEQTIAQGRIDQCSDVYSLGVVAYQMLTGQLPFEADTETQLLDMHRSMPPRPLREIQPDLPLAVEEVVLKAMAKRPQDRYQSATEFARALRQALDLANSQLIVRSIDAQTSAPVLTSGIYINGKHAGQADEKGGCRQSGLLPGQYLIEIEAPRYRRWEKSVELGLSEEISVSAWLERAETGEVLIACNVPDAEVQLNGQSAGRTDSSGRLFMRDLAAGRHSIQIQHPQYQPSEFSVDVETWQQTLARHELLPRQNWSLAHNVLSMFRSLTKEHRSPASSLSATDVEAENKSAERPPANQEIQTTCPTCGQRLSATMQFCTECGRRLLPLESGNDPTTTPIAARPDTPQNKKWILAGGGILLFAAMAAAAFLRSGRETATLSLKTSAQAIVIVDGRRETETDERGNLEIEGLPAGEHTLIISKPGFRELRRSVVLPLTAPIAPFILEREIPAEMAYIPGGSFLMGIGQADRVNPGSPAHPVTLKPYFIDIFEITMGSYYAVSGLTPAPAEETELPMPMNWEMAKTHCARLGKRLPSEAEWEFAARGQTGFLFPWGNSFARNRANVDNSNHAKTPVGSYKNGASPWGLFDMAGNLAEWTDTEYKNYPRSRHRARACQEPCKVIRGGAMHSPPNFATTIYRAPYETISLKKEAYNFIGARCAKDAP